MRVKLPVRELGADLRMPVPFAPLLLERHQAARHELAARLQVTRPFYVERLLVHGLGLGVACSELELELGGELSGHIPAEMFTPTAFGVRLKPVMLQPGAVIRLIVHWNPPRRPAYKPRIAKWRGAWWVTHTRPELDRLSAIAIVGFER